MFSLYEIFYFCHLPFFLLECLFFLIDLCSLYILSTNPIEVVWLLIPSLGLWLDFSFP